MNGPVPERRTRKPTGKPSWPMMCLAGVEKSGKSWAAAAFSASELVGKTYFIEVGENYADEYGRLPGVRYEIVPHDGTYRDIAASVEWAVKQPRDESGKPNCIIFDSGTVLWDMLSDHAHRAAYRRWRKNNPNDPEPTDEIVVTMDLWNIAKDKFAAIARMLYHHDGPAIITTRLEQVAVVVGGKPTTEKAWKVRAEKNLPFEVDAVIQARKPRTWEITGLRSTQLELPEGKTIPMPGFTVEGFLRRLGHDQPDATAPRSVTPLREDPRPQHQVAAAVARKEQEDRARLPRAVEWQRTALVLLMRDKLGITDRGQRLASMSRHLRRKIDSFTDITAGEADATIRALGALADHVPPAAPAQQAPPTAAPAPQMPAAESPVEPQPPRTAQDPGFRLPGAVGPEGICADMEAEIEACTDKAELDQVGQRIAEMAGNVVLYQSHRDRLDAAWRAKNTALNPPPPAAPDLAPPDRFTELADAIGSADLAGVDALVATATEARAAGEIDAMQLGVLTSLAEGRAQDLVRGDPTPNGWSHRALADQGAPL
ncbi:MAG TPA: hypothetical protein VGS97_20180 [Actinocrinis sp.]|uniref:hypothetical protein n=1 Tax=Actinocrinis sp. TaxID=1920516 RepID=UPI002DDCCFA0|nr:hypothetical protein [Actinocrinis sp.]HEV2346428.1 hypothetical protein [Actinocrinis sp.]